MAAYSSPSNMKFLHHDHVNAKTVRWPASASAIEELAALLETEDREGYGASQHISVNDEVERIILAWRTKVCDWYYEFIDTYDFDREVAGVALNYFDRYMVHQTDDMLNRERYQLTAVACLYVAIKIHSCANDRNAVAKAMARLYHGNHKNALVDMETDILQTLKWKVNPPTMHQFAMKYILLHPLGRISKRTNDTLYQATRYQVELTLYVPRLLEQFKPSVLTFAALMNASERLGPLALPPYINEQWLSIMPIVNITPSDVEAAQRALEEYFPKLPGMDQFDHYEEDEEEDSPGRRLGSASPTNVNFS